MGAANHDAIKVILDASPSGMRHAQGIMRSMINAIDAYVACQGRLLTFARRLGASQPRGDETNPRNSARGPVAVPDA